MWDYALLCTLDRHLAAAVLFVVLYPHLADLIVLRDACEHNLAVMLFMQRHRESFSPNAAEPIAVRLNDYCGGSFGRGEGLSSVSFGYETDYCTALANVKCAITLSMVQQFGRLCQQLAGQLSLYI